MQANFVLTIDLQTVDALAAWHGVRRESADPLFIFRKPMDRLEHFCAKHQIRPTLFTAAEDLVGPAEERLSQASASGYEIASYGYSHNYLLDQEQPGAILNQLRHAQEKFAQKLGLIPMGFRAPARIINEALLAELKSMQFAYDASSLPCMKTSWLNTARLVAYRLSAKPALCRPGHFANKEPLLNGKLVSLPPSTALGLAASCQNLFGFYPLYDNLLLSGLKKQETLIFNMSIFDFVDVQEDRPPPFLSRYWPSLHMDYTRRQEVMDCWLETLKAERENLSAATLAQTLSQN
ncbi:MAG: polysaccharide deacetylase family protein [Myxococcota bacterium]|nr:polysaccharide deacetylase family protein [Myxococcota bacterium]